MDRCLFELKADLTEIIGAKKVISATIGSVGELCLLLVTSEGEQLANGREEKDGFAIFPLSTAKQTYSATFIRYLDRVLQKTELREVRQAFPSCQPLPNGEILLTGARCHYRNGNPERNATVYDQNGMRSREFVLGDGIEDTQTDQTGMIWVSYFDEGIFGNFGWKTPMGAAGLVCFDGNGTKVWEFQESGGAAMIADCYALNVAENSVWACYYTDFPVIRIDPHRYVRAWSNSVSGAHAIAVNDRHVALYGGYRKLSRCILQEYGRSSTLSNAQELNVRFENEVDLKGVRIMGRGPSLHAFVGTRWYSWDIK